MKNTQKFNNLFFSLLFCMIIVIASCYSDDGTQDTLLKVINHYESRSITSVTLVGYEFNNLLITAGNSQSFALEKGMPSGYTNINITVGYSSGTATWYISKEFDFIEGEVTTITLKGSNLEGHPDYNNTRLE